MMIPKLSRVIVQRVEGKELKFTKGELKVYNWKCMQGEVNLCGIYKSSSSWKVESTFGNYWAISTLPAPIQIQLCALIEAELSGISFKQTEIHNIHFKD